MKNLLGVVLVALGIVMSLPGVPGQGILTILLGIMLLDFPGKRNLEHKMVSRPQVLNAINKLRHRFGKPSSGAGLDAMTLLREKRCCSLSQAFRARLGCEFRWQIEAN